MSDEDEFIPCTPTPEEIDAAIRFRLCDLWALLWCDDGCNIHVEPLQEAAQYGMGVLLGEQEPTNYVLIYAGPEAAVRAYAKAVQPYVNARREMHRRPDPACPDCKGSVPHCGGSLCQFRKTP